MEPSPFQYRDYRAFWAARLASTVGNTMLVVGDRIHVTTSPAGRDEPSSRRASGSHDRARAFLLCSLTLVAGYVADRVEPAWIVRSASTWRWRPPRRSPPGLARRDDAPAAFRGGGAARHGPRLRRPAELDRAQSGAGGFAAERDRLESIAWQRGAVAGPLHRRRRLCAVDQLPTTSAALYASPRCMMLIRPIPRGNAAIRTRCSR